MRQENALRQLDILKSRLTALQRRDGNPKSQKMSKKMLEECENAVERLSAIQERLVERNRNLSAARRRLEEEKRRYLNLFDFSPEAYLVTNRHAVIREANRAATVLFNLPKENLIGKPLGVYIAYPDFRRFLADTARAVQSGRAADIETRLRPSGGKMLDVVITLIADDKKASLRWAIRDVTERKQVDDKLRRSERIATMGATALLLAQDVSNPLNNIFTTVQCLERNLISYCKDETADLLQTTVTDLSQQTSRLRALLEKFRSFSQSTPFQFAAIDLCQMISEILADEGADYGARGVQVETFLPQKLLVQANYERLKQAFARICKNAVEAMPHGGTLTLQGHTVDGQVIVEVIDTGAGVSNEIDIFDLFTTTKFQAMGMGLPIARQIVLDHGGTISYSSKPGGTVFQIDLPTAGA